MLIYLIYFKPFDTFKDNLINIYNECVLVITFLMLAIIQFITQTSKSEMIIGWSLVGLILLSLLLTWILILPPIVKLVFTKCRAIFSYKKAATSNSSISLPYDSSPQIDNNRVFAAAGGRSTFVSIDRHRSIDEPEKTTEINSQETPRVPNGGISPKGTTENNAKALKSARAPHHKYSFNDNEITLRKDSNNIGEVAEVENEGKKKKKKGKGKKKKKERERQKK